MHDRLLLALQARERDQRHSPKLHAALPIANELLRWYDETKREIPWRTRLSDQERRDLPVETQSQMAYQIWVSEIMCQQTRIATVIPYYEKWMAKFPTLRDLANGTVDDVRALWAGLGYYSRGTRLLAGAQHIVAKHRGLMPNTAKALQKEVTGVGEYTAAAIASIAYSERIAAIDGNVQRVASRLLAIHANLAAKATKDSFAHAVNAMVPASRPGDFNQALMDLGALICTPQNPKCSACPLSKQCIAYAVQSNKGKAKALDVPVGDACKTCSPLPEPSCLEVTIYPMAKVKTKVTQQDTPVCILEWRSTVRKDDSRLLLVKRPEQGLLAGMLEFPNVDLSRPAGGSLKPLGKLIQSLLGLSAPFEARITNSSAPLHVHSLKTYAPYNHKFSHIDRDYYPTHCVIMSADLPKIKVARWVQTERLLDEAISLPMQKIWQIKSGTLAPKKKRASRAVTPLDSSSHEDQPVAELPPPVKPRKIRRIQESSEEDA